MLRRSAAGAATLARLRPPSRGARLAAAVACGAALLVSACVPEDLLSTAKAVPDTPANTEYRLASRQSAWSAQPGVLVVLQRNTVAGRQQVIGLANDTVLPGDNYLALIAYGAGNDIPKRFDLATVASRINGIPSPFGTLTDTDLLQRRDALGSYLVAEKSAGGGATCVLAIRRIAAVSRILPPGTAAMEIVLRNCAIGSAATALAPFRAERLAIDLAAAYVNGGVQPRVLNPLAAPEQ